MLANEGGGISSVSRGLAHALLKLEIETTIFITTARPKTHVEKTGKYLKIVYLPMINLPPRSVWFLARYFHTISGLLKDYDLVHAVNPELAIGLTFFTSELRRPLVTTLHGSNRAYLKAFLELPARRWVQSDFAFHVLELPLHDMVTKRCIAKSNRTVVCSHTTLNELKTCEKSDVSKISVIYNGIDFDEIQGEDVTSHSGRGKGDELSMIYAGRLFWMKGITFVLEAYDSLRKQFGNLHLRIFGRGPMKGEIEKFIANRRLKNEVYFGGFLPHQELIKEVKEADLVVFPSLYESQPMFALEAMACQKPVVAFDLPYAREIIVNGKNGLLAKAYDLEDLCNKTSTALCDKNLRRSLGQNGYDYVKRNHDWDAQAGKYLKVYEALIADGK